MKAFIFSLVLTLTLSITGCAKLENNATFIKLKEFLEVLKDNKTAQTDFYQEYKTFIESGESFIMNRSYETEFSYSYETIYCSSSYLYKFSTIIGEDFSVNTHKLYLANGNSYDFDGVNVVKGKSVDFIEIKRRHVSDLFLDSLNWAEVESGYICIDEEIERQIIKTDNKDKIEYIIKYETIDASITYKGDITLTSEENFNIPNALKIIINEYET